MPKWMHSNWHDTGRKAELRRPRRRRRRIPNVTEHKTNLPKRYNTILCHYFAPLSRCIYTETKTTRVYNATKRIKDREKAYISDKTFLRVRFALKFRFLSFPPLRDVCIYIYIFTTWLTFNPPSPAPLTAWPRVSVWGKGMEPARCQRAKERKENFDILREGYNTPVPECSPFYWPGMKQRWRRCDFWGNVVLWFPSRNFILALHPYRALSPPLLATAPPTSNIPRIYISLA